MIGCAPAESKKALTSIETVLPENEGNACSILICYFDFLLLLWNYNFVSAYIYVLESAYIYPILSI